MSSRTPTSDAGEEQVLQAHYDLPARGFWISAKQIREDDNRVQIPRDVINLDIIDASDPNPDVPNEDVFWGWTKETVYPTRYIVISKYKKNIKESTNHVSKNNTSIQPNLTVTLPKNFFVDEYEGTEAYSSPVDDDLSLSYNEVLHFVTTGNMFKEKNLCYVIPQRKITEKSFGERCPLVRKLGEAVQRPEKRDEPIASIDGASKQQSETPGE